MRDNAGARAVRLSVLYITILLVYAYSGMK